MTLLSTAENYGVQDKLTEAEKEENLDLILRRNKFSELPFKYSQHEKKQILDYCQSDTEVLLEGWKSHGDKILDKLDGMFAFAIWDGKKLNIATDIFGEKPIFLFKSDDFICGCSELNVLAQLFCLEKKIDTEDQENKKEDLQAEKN